MKALFDPRIEHDACGVGFVCHLKGRPSHGIVEDGLKMLENMSHRGACGCEPDSGDGAGVMVQLPHAFFERRCRSLGIILPPPGRYAVGMLFLPQDLAVRRACERILEETVRDYGMVVLGWRDVPVDSRAVGPTPRRSEPRVRQVFIGIGERFYNQADFDRRLYLVRQRTENRIEHSPLWDKSEDQLYICILSAGRTVYKGMLTALQLRRYYPDLSEPDFESRFALVHSRFSTNTLPSWRLAQPFRYLAHNGEINTLRGNRNWMRARYATLRSEVFGDELGKMFPLFSERVSDSATLDNAMQFLAVNGRALPHAALMLVPEAWQGDGAMDDDLRAFYEYHACLMEPWDGPAAVAFTDGHTIGALLDRNGLRPARYYLTKDDRVILASEAGVLPVPPEQVVYKGRVRPGRLFLVDLDAGRVVPDDEIKQGLMDQRPYRRWLDRNLLQLKDLPVLVPEPEISPPGPELTTLQRAFGYTQEDLRLILGPMAATGAEPVGSMGTDTPLACLSEEPQLLYGYFRQLFAQVTNPPLDAIREELVTALDTYLGREGNLLSEDPAACRLLKLPHPMLTSEELERIRRVLGSECAQPSPGALRAVTLPALFPLSGPGAGDLMAAVDALCDAAAQAVRDGCTLLILSDRGVDAERAPIPALLATAAVHHHLIREGTRTLAGLIIETGEAREVHHLCLLLGYGAGAINPYLALDSIAELQRAGLLYPPGAPHPASRRPTVAEAQRNYCKAACKGILKVASKMGISTLQSYRGAQIFEAVGLDESLIDRCFWGTAARLHGISAALIGREAILRHQRAFAPLPTEQRDALPPGGQYQWRREGERHLWNPDTIATLQHAVRNNDQGRFRHFSQLADAEARYTLRGCLELRPAGPPVPLAEVEPAEEIARRFVTGAMSFGSISQEAHEALAVAMNRLGGRSNSGEGGEDPARYRGAAGGPSRNSAIKQVASARFGVTASYLVSADELQIKMAQGAKPGEGGQLPGEKVDATIARVRHSTPGVGLISPPPHHDIYSIEDLAQLIHDLKHVNPRARISVKLVSEYGVGTIAAGVVKARADHVLVSGDGGGTGAAPLSSIKHAGLPWELGLAETQQVLIENRLRGRVRLQVDGQLKTGRDVIIAALLGAEEFGFSTAALVSLGCVMMRVCHLNTCPVGIATQDPELRRRFAGEPEHVLRFMLMIAEDVREHLAALGLRRLDEAVGRGDCLQPRDLEAHWKARHLNLSPVLWQSDAPGPRRCVERQEHDLETTVDHELLRYLDQAAARGAPEQVHMTLRNTHRSVGAMLAGRVAERHGDKGLPDDLLTCRFSGTAGQSFGAFLTGGLTFILEGDANDYLGKGLCGGKIIVYPPADAGFAARDCVIAGNVIAYGATSGEIYLRGVAGERFCVRNSGATAVVEGVGDHGCEYMTGGVVVVLGLTGRNFAAGMSGGVAYVLDVDGAARSRCNLELVSPEPLDEADEALLRDLLGRHARHTGSEVAEALLADLPAAAGRFLKLMPHDLRRALQAQRREVA